MNVIDSQTGTLAYMTDNCLDQHVSTRQTVAGGLIGSFCASMSWAPHTRAAPHAPLLECPMQ